MQTALQVPSRRRKFKLRSSTKLVVGAIVLFGGGFAVWTYGVGAYVLSRHFPLLTPGKVSLIGLKTGHGFTIQVSNRVAHLVESKDINFASSKNDQEETGETEGAAKKKIPVRDMVNALTGDEAALSSFVTALADLDPKEDWPSTAPVWKAEDVQKALDGDQALRTKLVNDLNVNLDGQPLDQLSTAALANGIMVDAPIPIHVQVGGEQRVMTARLKRWYQPAIMKATNAKFKERFNVTNREKAAYYLDTVRASQSGKGKAENVEAAIRHLLTPEDVMDAVNLAEQVLSSAFVVLTDADIEKASYHASEVGNRDMGGAPGAAGLFDFDLQVNEDGRMRLWQYSKLHPHDQLLLVSNGVAIAAPRIRHELVGSNLTIVQMPDEGLLQDAVATLNKK